MLSYLKANLESSNSEKDLSKVNIIEADVCNTSIPDQSVDLIIFANILHDLEDRRSFFKELKRISRKTARVIDIDWHKRNTDDLGPPLNRRLSENEARISIRDNGLVIVYALNPGSYHYGFVCQQA